MSDLTLTVAAFLLLITTWTTCQAACEQGFQTLPQNLQWVKEDLIELGRNNQDQWADEDLQVFVDDWTLQLEDWYVNNRPLNEVELERGAWKVLWFFPDPPFDFGVPGFALDRDNSYQVVTNRTRGGIGNIAKYDLGLSVFSTPLTFFVIEEVKLTNPHTSETCGQKEVNAWDLTFPLFAFELELGWAGKNLDEVFISMLDGERMTLPVPFPIEAGDFFDWVRFMDEDVRIVQHGNQQHVYVRGLRI